MPMNEVEILRHTNGQIASVTIDGTPIKAQTLVVCDNLDDCTEVTIVMKARVKGYNV